MVSAPASPFPSQRQAPPGWTYLDYPHAEILIQATTKWEKGFRRECTAKEPWTVAWIEAMPAGSVLWNVGACVGSYALISASRGVYTVAIEPGYASYAALVNNCLANRFEDRMTPLCLAISDGIGITPLAYRSTEAGAASHGFGVVGPQQSAGTVPTVTFAIDWLASCLPIPLPTHLLIDVDGAEAAVLRGAGQTLRQHVRSVMIEVQAGQEATIGEHFITAGFAETNRFTERGGQRMAGIHYAEYRRG